MEKRKPGIGGIPDPETGFILVAVGTAKHPDIESFPDPRYRGGLVVGVRCGCGADRSYTRLADGRVKICPHCGAVMSRIGRRVVAANWENVGKPLPS